MKISASIGETLTWMGGEGIDAATGTPVLLMVGDTVTALGQDTRTYRTQLFVVEDRYGRVLFVRPSSLKAGVDRTVSRVASATSDDYDLARYVWETIRREDPDSAATFFRTTPEIRENLVQDILVSMGYPSEKATEIADLIAETVQGENYAMREEDLLREASENSDDDDYEFPYHSVDEVEEDEKVGADGYRFPYASTSSEDPFLSRSLASLVEASDDEKRTAIAFLQELTGALDAKVGMIKSGRREYSPSERQALIDEEGFSEESLHSLDLDGTHYL